MQISLSSTELARTADVIAQGSYEAYPAHDKRLFLGAAGLVAAETEFYVPDGPWHVTGHSNREGVHPAKLDAEIPGPGQTHVAGELCKVWQRESLVLDQYGRPTHPNAVQLLSHPGIGLPTGLGFFYKYGPNRTIDAVVPRRVDRDSSIELLLIKRKVGGRWALPGGFLDRTDATPEAGARREAGEETGLADIGGIGEELVHKRPVGLRDTLHAWTENIVVLIRGDQDYLYDTELKVGDDADDAGWFTQEAIGGLAVFDAHPQYIDEAFRRLGT